MTYNHYRTIRFRNQSDVCMHLLNGDFLRNEAVRENSKIFFWVLPSLDLAPVLGGEYGKDLRIYVFYSPPDGGGVKGGIPLLTHTLLFLFPSYLYTPHYEMRLST